MAVASPTKRPELSRMRRRSTIEWAMATPQKRQQRLEAVTKDRMADVFFSLHVKDVEGVLQARVRNWEVSKLTVSSRASICLGDDREDD
jgi:hypothetical protein